MRSGASASISCEQLGAVGDRRDGVAVLAQQPGERAGDDRIALGDDDAEPADVAGVSPEELTQSVPLDVAAAQHGHRRPLRAAAPCPSSSAATVIAPLGSTTSLSRSSSRRIAPRSAESSTSTTSSMIALMVRERQRADLDGEQAVGEPARCARGAPDDPLRAHGVSFGAPVGSTPITRAFGSAQLDRRRDAGAEAAAAHRHEHRVDVRQIRGDLESDRALARDDPSDGRTAGRA